jgi:hypothetical protein
VRLDQNTPGVAVEAHSSLTEVGRQLLAEAAVAATTKPVEVDGRTEDEWAHSGLNFGEDPEDAHGYAQIWACSHNFKQYEPRDRTGIR